MQVIALFALSLSYSCAARQTLDSGSARIVLLDIEELFQRGCYSCLTGAFKAALSSELRTKAYEAALTLAIRSTELGLPRESWLQRAEEVLPDGPGWASYLAMVAALPQDRLSGDRDRLLDSNARGRAALRDWQPPVTAPGSPAFRAYIDLAVACRHEHYEGRDTAATEALRLFPAVPLLTYKAALCSTDHTSLLLAARRADPQFVDADLELAQAALRRQPTEEEEALRRLQSASKAFPESAVIGTQLGLLHQRWEDWPQALNAFDAVLNRVPTHRDALIGRTVALSRLSRHSDAIASAGRLIELGSWFIGEAHYWRAWNRYLIGEIQAARADADRAKALLGDASTLVLSGLIEWRQTRLETAELELQKAIRLDRTVCEARTYLGSVRSERHRWEEALADFETAVRCFDEAILQEREQLASIDAADISIQAQVELTAGHHRRIEEAEYLRREATRGADAVRARLRGSQGS